MSAGHLSGVIARRVGTAIVIALLVGSITFVVARVLPGSPASLLAGPSATPEVVAKIDRDLGLDQPIPAQYVDYMGDLVRFDFGTSIQSGRPVLTDLGERLPATLELVVGALLFGALGGVALGVFAAIRGRGPVASAVGITGLLGAAIPEFWLGLVLIAVFYVGLGWTDDPFGRLPADMAPPGDVTGFYTADSLLTGNLQTFGPAVGHLLMPSIVLAIVILAPISRVTRAAMRDTLTEDFVLAARANGEHGLRLYCGRVLPVAAPPILTVIALATGFLLAGAALVEQVFAWPGIGHYAVQAVQLGDYAALQGVVVVVALLYVLIFLVAEVVGMLLDPRTANRRR